jgi:ABC-type uncharacterized transport system permease subunit
MSATAPTARSRLSAPAWLRKLWLLLAESVVAILLALVVGGIGIAAFSGLLPNHSSFDLGLPIAAYGALWSGAVGSTNGITSTLVYSTPLILAGLGVGLGFKAGLFNIGGRGQFLMGTVGAMSVVTLIGSSTPGYITIPLALIVGAALGGFAGFIPGVLKATSGAHEVVTTIMLNYILVFTTYWAISGPLRLPNSPQPITVDVTTRPRTRRPHRHPLRAVGRSAGLVPPVSNHAGLRAEDRRCQLRRGSLRRHEDAAVDRPGDDSGRGVVRSRRRDHASRRGSPESPGL